MNRRAVLLLHLLVAVLTLSGIGFAWMKYGMTTDDPFAAANHPWQPTLLAVHVVAAAPATFALGWLFSSHVWPKFRSPTRGRRTTGVAMMVVGAPMVLSAYLLQTATSEGFRLASAATHWATSALFAAGYLGHLLTRRPR